MSRKVYATVTIKVIVNLDDGVDFNDFMNDCDYGFNAPPEEGGEFLDTQNRRNQWNNSSTSPK